MSQSSENHARCLVCRQTSAAVPLIRFEYQGSQNWICPQHLPILIHKPAELAGILPGAEKLVGGEG